MKRRYIIVFILFVILSSVPFDNLVAQTQVRIGGYLQTWLLLRQHQEIDGDDWDTWGFRLRRARLSAQTDITDGISINAWMEFAGTDRNLLDFFITARISENLRLRGGQFRPSGQMYDTGILSSSQLIFYERPAVSTRIASIMGYDAYRDIGIMAMGSHNAITYSFHITNGMGRFQQAGSNIRSRGFGSGLYGGRVDIAVTDILTIGGHASINKQEDVVRDGSPAYDIDRVSYSFRGAIDNKHTPGLFSQFEIGGGKVDDTDNFDFFGWYIEAGYRLSNSISLLARYDQFREDPARQTYREEQSIVLGTVFYWLRDNREYLRYGINLAFGNDLDDRSRNAIIFWFQVRFP